MNPRTAKLALVALAIAFVVTHVSAIYTETINWDEFVLLQRGERTLVTGQLQGGGRPGLGTLAVVPFAYDCTSSIDAVHSARLAWSLLTFGLLAGLFVFVKRATRRDAHSWHAAALAVGMLALVPVFVQWSLHVRTDQPAIAAGLWAGVALLASANRVRWAIAAGFLLGIGYFFSQKAVYLSALVALVAVGDLYSEGKAELRREAMRVGGVVAGALVAAIGYRYVVPAFYATPEAVSVEAGLNQFDFYRSALGYRTYVAMLPTLVPHLVLLGLLVVATFRAIRRGTDYRRSLLVALAVAALGLAVGKFHAAAFPYFWMTLGVFFATSIAIGWAGICDLYPRGRVVLALLVWAALAANGVRAIAVAFYDSQAIQRDTLGFVERNFDESKRSYDTHGALFCRSDPDPIPGALISSIIARFASRQYTDYFIAELRARPIAVVMLPNQIGNYPHEVIDFWNAHYVRYYGPVRVAGRMIAGKAGSRHDVEIIVPGRYRWRTRDGVPARITVDGGTSFELAAGTHVVELLDDADGMFVLDVKDPPWLGTTQFYSRRDDQEWHEALDKKRPPPIYR